MISLGSSEYGLSSGSRCPILRRPSVFSRSSLVYHTYWVSPHCSLLVPMLRPLFFSRREWRQVSEYPKKRQLKLKHGALCSCGTLYDLNWGKVLSSFSSTGREVDSDDSTDSPVSAFFNFLCCTRGKVMTDDQVPCHCFGALHCPSTEGFSL